MVTIRYTEQILTQVKNYIPWQVADAIYVTPIPTLTQKLGLGLL
jgi:hypothetical protein